MSIPLFPARLAARVARIIGLLSVAVALGACSAIKLGYATLPEVAYWWLGSYVELDDTQAQRVREDIARVHAWHRSTELPRIIGLLQRIERIAPADTTPEQVCAFEPELRERYQALRDRAEPAIVTNALSLDPAQLQHIERKFAQNNRDYEKDWLRLSPAERLDKRMKQVVDRAEMVYGTLTDAQRGALRQHLQDSGFDAAQVLAERKRRQQDTLAVLRKLAGQPIALSDARAQVHGLLERYSASPDPAYRRFQLAFPQATCRLVAALHNGATREQREHAVRRLRAWQRDLAELSQAR